MAFIDGENFTIRGQEAAKAYGFKFTEGPYYLKDVFLWMLLAQNPAARRLFVTAHQPSLDNYAIRSYYYTSIVGDDDKRKSVHQALWDLGFSPRVFKKDKSSQKSKGVDISLCTDMLSHGFADDYEVAVLVTGDGDYLPLVEAVKRMGHVVLLAGFKCGLSEDLKLAADGFFDLTEHYKHWWEHYKAP